MAETHESIFECDGRVKPSFDRAYAHPSDRHPRLHPGWWIIPLAFMGAMLWAGVILAAVLA